MNDTAKQHEQAVCQRIGGNLKPITSADELLGEWEMRFGGPGGSSKVQWHYRFQPDGSVQVSDEQWQWRFNPDGTISLASQEEDDSEAEVMYPYQADDGRIVLANDDVSLIEVLTRVAG